MTSAGNDIVCIAATDIPRTKQPVFYSRILSPSEQALYSTPQYASIPFAYFVWLLWSVKESAFKYLQRATPMLVFSPTKFIVTQLYLPPEFAVGSFAETEMVQRGFGNGALKGVVAYADLSLSSRSLIYREAIVSVVNGEDNFDDICWGIKAVTAPDPDSQSAAVRSFLAGVLKEQYGADEVIVCKTTDGIPFLSLNNGKTVLPLSLSHHGNFVGYSFLRDK
jgi:phosphopantetheinyl transferase (holo-ACP synthase)